MGTMYLTLQGYADLTETGKISSYTRTIAYCLPFPSFPISLYTLYSCDDDAYYLSLSTQSGDVTEERLLDLYTKFYRYIFTVNCAIISMRPPKLAFRAGMYDLVAPPKAQLCTLTGVDVNLFSYSSNSITFLSRLRGATNTELQITALRAVTHHPIDAHFSRLAYSSGRMSARGYWYVAA